MLDLDQIKFRRQEWQLVGKRWILFGRPGRVGVEYFCLLFVGWFERLSVPDGAGEGGERRKWGTEDMASAGRTA